MQNNATSTMIPAMMILRFICVRSIIRMTIARSVLNRTIIQPLPMTMPVKINTNPAPMLISATITQHDLNTVMIAAKSGRPSAMGRLRASHQISTRLYVIANSVPTPLRWSIFNSNPIAINSDEMTPSKTNSIITRSMRAN